jgi:hypothetical protein
MEDLLQQGTVFRHPAIDCRVIDRHPSFLREFFHMTNAQQVDHVPPHTDQDNVLGKWVPLKLTISVPPLLFRCVMEGDLTPDRLHMEICDRPPRPHPPPCDPPPR